MALNLNSTLVVGGRRVSNQGRQYQIESQVAPFEGGARNTSGISKSSHKRYQFSSYADDNSNADQQHAEFFSLNTKSSSSQAASKSQRARRTIPLDALLVDALDQTRPSPKRRGSLDSNSTTHVPSQSFGEGGRTILPLLAAADDEDVDPMDDPRTLFKPRQRISSRRSSLAATGRDAKSQRERRTIPMMEEKDAAACRNSTRGTRMVPLVKKDGDVRLPKRRPQRCKSLGQHANTGSSSHQRKSGARKVPLDNNDQDNGGQETPSNDGPNVARVLDKGQTLLALSANGQGPSNQGHVGPLWIPAEDHPRTIIPPVVGEHPMGASPGEHHLKRRQVRTTAALLVVPIECKN